MNNVIRSFITIYIVSVLLCMGCSKSDKSTVKPVDSTTKKTPDSTIIQPMADSFSRTYTHRLDGIKKWKSILYTESIYGINSYNEPDTSFIIVTQNDTIVKVYGRVLTYIPHTIFHGGKTWQTNNSQYLLYGTGDNSYSSVLYYYYKNDSISLDFSTTMTGTTSDLVYYTK